MKRINKLNNVGRFVSLRSGSGSQAEFSRLNVIYAPNGSGKTTICDAFRSLGTKKTEYLVGRKRLSSTGAVEVELLFKGTPTVRAWIAGNQWQVEPTNGTIPKFFVYDDRFVADNVLIGQSVLVEQRRNIYGLALGDRARTLKGAVEVAEGSLSDASEELAKARTALNALVPSGWKGDDFRALLADPIINERIVAAQAALDAGRKAKQNAEAIRQRKPLAVMVVPEMPGAIQQILRTTLEDAAIQAEAKIQQHLSRCTSGLRMEWIGEGHRAQRGTSCPHCGRDMDGLEILKAYRSFFSGELRSQQVAQDGLQQAIDSLFGVAAQQRVEQMLTSHFVERDWWRDAAGITLDFPACPAIEEIRGAMGGVHSSVSEAIRRKRSQPALAITLDDSARLALERWGSVSESLSRYLSSLAALNAVIAKHQDSVSAIDLVVLEREHSTLLAQKLRHEPATVEALRVFDAAIAKKGAAEKSKAEANAALRQQSEQVLREYGERINALLVSFSVGFRIVPVGVNFHGGPPAGDIAIEILGNRISATAEDARNPSKPSLANTLSSGDRSALALAFFIAVAEHDSAIADSIVVFDDPFHSQDRSRRRRTVECLQRIAGVARQCFVMSHELDFAREVARAPMAQVTTFTLNPLGERAELLPGELPPLPSRAYQQDYSRLAGFLDEPAAETDHKGVARCIRQALETYLRIKFPTIWAEDAWLGGMIGDLSAASSGSPLHRAAHLSVSLSQINEWGKRYYHAETDGSANGEVDPVELKAYVEQTIDIISR